MRIAFVGASGTGKSTLAKHVLSLRPDLLLNPVGSRSTAKAMGFVHPPGSEHAGEGDPYGTDNALAAKYSTVLGNPEAYRNLPRIGITTHPDTGETMWGRLDTRGPERGEELAAEVATASFNEGQRRLVAGLQGPGRSAELQGPTCRSLFQQRLQSDKIRWELDHDAFVTDRTTIDDLAYAVLHNRETVDGAFLDRALDHMARYDAIYYCPVGVYQNIDADPSRVTDVAYHCMCDALVAGFVSQVERRQPRTYIRTLTRADLDWRKGVLAQACAAYHEGDEEGADVLAALGVPAPPQNSPPGIDWMGIRMERYGLVTIHMAANPGGPSGPLCGNTGGRWGISDEQARVTCPTCLRSLAAHADGK